MSDLFNNNILQGQVALVTGASRGIGAAIAAALGDAGATVIGTATSEAGATAIGVALGDRAGVWFSISPAMSQCSPSLRIFRLPKVL